MLTGWEALVDLNTTMSQQTILNYYMSNKASKPREFDDFEGIKGGKRKSSDVDHEIEESYDFEVPKKQHLSVVGNQNFPLTPILQSVGLRTKTFHDRIYGQVDFCIFHLSSPMISLRLSWIH